MKWQRLIRQTLPYAAAAGLLVGLQCSPVVETANLLVYDLAINLRNRSNEGGAEDLTWPITVVGMNEDDIKRYGWPLDDTLLCRALKQLDALGASAIGLDLYRDQAKPCLQDEIQRNPRLISIRNEVVGIAAIPGAPARQQAFNDLLMDADRVVRRDLIHVDGQAEAVRSLPLRLLETASQARDLDKQLEQLKDHHWLREQSGGYQSLDAAGYQAMLPVYPPGRYPVLDLAELLEGEVHEAMIRNRIVLIGSVAPSLHDRFEIPQSRFIRGSQFFSLTGVELHAQRLEALQRMLQSRAPQIVTVQGWQRTLLLLVMMLVGGVIAERPDRIRRSIVLLTATSILLTGSVFLLTLSGLWIGITMPLAGLLLISGSGILRRGVQSQRHQQDMRRLLGQTSSPAVAQQLWEQREELINDGRFTGRELPVTVLFSDTCSFTGVSEKLTPSELMQWLNRGMSIGVDSVSSRGGIVNKFTGDGMLAVFGAPVSRGKDVDAGHAVAAALAIQKQITALNDILKMEGQPALRMRIGIHSGPVLTGSLGSNKRLEYAVIGDTVNCASRLEGLEKNRHQGIVRVLISEETLELLEELPAEVTREAWGTMNVKGRQEPLNVFELRSTAT
tara:strand:+ start:313 stop:2163 length:1851 start_codon:yes stop_codon:yes gene_type:complete